VAFPKGNKAASGGKREGAGRPIKEELAERESLRAAIERKREERAAALAEKYLAMAEEDPATMRHLVNKVMPDLDETLPAPRAITFIQFNNSLQLPAKNIPVTIKQPASKENRLPEEQGLKFYDFAKRRD
jgi:hypothetical protein